MIISQMVLFRDNRVFALKLLTYHVILTVCYGNVSLLTRRYEFNNTTFYDDLLTNPSKKLILNSNNKIKETIFCE